MHTSPRLKLIMVFSLLLFFIVGLALRSFGSVTTHAATNSYAWRIVPSANVGTSANDLYGVTATSSTNAWAVGTNSNTFIEHWDGANWNIVPSPQIAGILRGVRAVNANDIWAVGYSYGIYLEPIVEHWDGSTWSTVSSPAPGVNDNFLMAVATVASNNVWAVGTSHTNNNSQTLIVHWNGTYWNQVPSPNPGAYNSLLGIKVISANDIWAVGAYVVSYGNGLNRTLIEHWNGTTWTVVPSPSPSASGNDLSTLAISSANNVWAVGAQVTNTGSQQTLIEHWNGTKWKVIASPNPTSYYGFAGAATLSANNVWAVGGALNYNTPHPLLVANWNGTSWGAVSNPNIEPGRSELNDVTRVPGTSSLLAVGCYSNSNNDPSQTLIESYS